MKRIIFFVFLVLIIVRAGYAGEIIINNADTTWAFSPEKPVGAKPVEIRMIAYYANSIYRNTLNNLPEGLEALVYQMVPRPIIRDANSYFGRELIQMQPVFANFYGKANGASVMLTWENLRLLEFSDVLIIYSQKRISWHPLDGISYQIGNEVDNGVFIGFIGSGKSEIISGLSPQTIYNFAIFGCNSGLTEYSMGSYTSVKTGEPTGIQVWPGDTDNNGLVDERDVLPIGMYWARTGPPRVAASAEWKPQPAQVWSPLMVTYADANGDGVVDERDVLPIGINWNKTHEVPQGAPSIDVASIDHSRNLNAYLAIIAGLGDLSNDEAAAEIREFLQDIISLSESEMIPKENSLLSNYPNPFNPETWIPFELASDSKVTIEIHDVSGRLIRKLDLGNLQAGVYRSKQLAAYWNGKTETGEMAASGVYFYTIRANGFSAVRKMILIK